VVVCKKTEKTRGGKKIRERTESKLAQTPPASTVSYSCISILKTRSEGEEEGMEEGDAGCCIHLGIFAVLPFGSCCICRCGQTEEGEEILAQKDYERSNREANYILKIPRSAIERGVNDTLQES